MTDSIEDLDRKRRRYLLIYLLSFGVFFLTFTLRFILKNAGVALGASDWILGITFGLSLPFQAYGAWGLNSVRRQVKRDPEKYAALYDELVKYQEMKAWKFGFIGMAACLAVFCVASIFATIKDIPSLMFISLWAGFGGYHLSFYLMNRG
jgi:hypothetical protein